LRPLHIDQIAHRGKRTHWQRWLRVFVVCITLALTATAGQAVEHTVIG